MPCSLRYRIWRNSLEKIGRKERRSRNVTGWALGAARSMCGLWSQDQFVEV
jgi:hypothetical protein